MSRFGPNPIITNVLQNTLTHTQTCGYTFTKYANLLPKFSFRNFFVNKKYTKWEFTCLLLDLRGGEDYRLSKIIFQ